MSKNNFKVNVDMSLHEVMILHMLLKGYVHSLTVAEYFTVSKTHLIHIKWSLYTCMISLSKIPLSYM